MPRTRSRRFTIYDRMDEAGMFDSNPANTFAQAPTGEPLYKGPIQYPKMFYHPTGAKRVVEPERVEPTPTGPVRVPARYEMISQAAANAEEEETLRASGWHDHPADAIAAGGGTAPPKGTDDEIARLRRQIAELQAQADAQAARQALKPGPEAKPPVGGKSTGDTAPGNSLAARLG